MRRMLAHDIRSPLGVVLGHGQLLEEGLVSPEEARATGTVMMRQVQRIGALADSAATDALEGASSVLGVRRVPLGPVLQAVGIDALGAQGGGVWGRPGALQELLVRLTDVTPAALDSAWRVSTSVRPARLVLHFACEEARAEAAFTECGRALRALGGSLRIGGGAGRLELPGDDGRLAVTVCGGTPSLLEGLRGQGLRVAAEGEAADVMLAAEGGGAPLSLAPTLHLGAGRGPCSVPARQEPAHLARLLRAVATQPLCLDPVTGAEPADEDAAGFHIRLQVMAAGPLGEEELTAALVELLETHPGVARLRAAPAGLLVATRSEDVAPWMREEGLPRVLPGFPGVQVSLDTVGSAQDASLA
jgi:hypothetical protein